MPKPMPTSGSSASMRAVARGPASWPSRSTLTSSADAGRRREAADRCRQAGARVGTHLPAGRELAEHRMLPGIDAEGHDDIAGHLHGRQRHRPDRRLARRPDQRRARRLPRLQLGREGAQRLDDPQALACPASPRGRADADATHDVDRPASEPVDGNGAGGAAPRPQGRRPGHPATAGPPARPRQRPAATAATSSERPATHGRAAPRVARGPPPAPAARPDGSGRAPSLTSPAASALEHMDPLQDAPPEVVAPEMQDGVDARTDQGVHGEPVESRGEPERLEAGRDVGRRVRVHGSGAAFVAGVHRREQVDDLGPADLAEHEAVGAHAQRLAHEVAQRHDARALDVGGARLHAHDVRMVGVELRRVLDDDEALGAAASGRAATDSTVVLPEPVPPLTRKASRAAIIARRTSAPASSMVPRSTRSSRVNAERCGTRSEISVPPTEIGGMTQCRRAPFGSRASTNGAASSRRRPAAAASRWASRRTSDSVAEHDVRPLEALRRGRPRPRRVR